jgi:hypothetical protein
MALRDSAGCALVAVFTVMIWGAAMAQSSSANLPMPARDMLEEYCVTCHNFEDYAGSLDLELILSDPFLSQAEDWEKVIRKLRAGMMPPPGQDRPEWDHYVALTQWVEAQVDQEAPLQPGTVGMHRLNRSEYANAIEEMLSIEIDPSLYLPADTSSRGFDNQAGSLTLSPTLLDAYINAAAEISSMAVGFSSSPGEVMYIVPADTSQTNHMEGMPFNTRGGMVVEHTFPADGEYKFSIQNFGVGTFHPGEQLELSIDGERVQLWDFVGVGLVEGMGGDDDGTLDATIQVKAGSRVIGATFLATNYRPSNNMLQEYERKSIENNEIPQVQLHPEIGLMKVIGPFNAQQPVDSESLKKVFTCQPSNADEAPQCAREIISSLARQAYRRPVTDADMRPLMAFYQQGVNSGSFRVGIELALRRLLADPKFLVRTEAEPEEVEVGEFYQITDLELASRMSFFLWSSIPDDELIYLAVAGRLSEPEVLKQQVNRMLQDPRSEALVENFAQQWFYLRNLPSIFPDSIYYPDWDAELRVAFQRETELLFQSIVDEDSSILTLLDANYTFINGRLAKHYGIPNVYGSHFRPIELPPEMDYRRGILGKGSFLSIASTEAFRTSPVKRGVWVLENLLGTPPPAPPANVPALEETGATVRIQTLRDQLEMHRENEPCATCHQIMDGIGFALESFDLDGSYRTIAGHPRQFEGVSVPLDTSVVLWDGTPVDGVSELRENLMKYSPQFVRFAVEKLMTYGVGRGVEYYDMPVIRNIVEEAENDNYRFSTLVLGVIESPQFLMRTKTGQDSSEVAALDRQ